MVVFIFLSLATMALRHNLVIFTKNPYQDVNITGSYGRKEFLKMK
jgi:hypothetical protein